MIAPQTSPSLALRRVSQVVYFPFPGDRSKLLIIVPFSIVYMFLRTALPFFWYYDKNVDPLTSFSWTFPIRMGLWQLSLDYFFARLFLGGVFFLSLT